MEDDEIGSEAQQRTSKYNSGIAQIMRMDELWKDTHRHCRQGMLGKWNWDLDRVWLELAGDLEEDNKKHMVYINKFASLNKDLSKNLKSPASYYQCLVAKELFLRRLQNYLGKGTSFDVGDEEYMDV